MPVLELAAGDQDHRVVGIRPLVGGNDVSRDEARLAAFAREGLGEDDRLARPLLHRARYRMPGRPENEYVWTGSGN